MKDGKWDKAAFEGNELWKKKIGIVGFGRIGQIVATRLAGFEVEVLFKAYFLYIVVGSTRESEKTEIRTYSANKK
jgi:phosphoglycerate dehydrogenase-like enzyme